MNKFFVPIIAFLFIGSCNSHKKFEANWIIISLQYKENEIFDSFPSGNVILAYGDDKGYTPPIDWGMFFEEHIAYQNNMVFLNKKGRSYIKIQGSKFFTDTWEVKCLGDGCCTVSLTAEDKYVELIYNSELSPLSQSVGIVRWLGIG